MAFVGEAFLSTLLQSIINELASPVIKEFRIRQGIDKDLKRLGKILPTIQLVLDDAEQKELSDPSGESVTLWLKKLTDVAYDIDDIMDELAYEVEVSKMKGETQTCTNQVWNLIFPKCINVFLFKQYRAHEIVGVMERLQEIENDRKILGLNERVRSRWLEKTERLQMTSVTGESNSVVGRETDTNKIIELLLKPSRNNVSVVSIVGLGGLGKTTLAQYVFDDKTVKDHFEIKAWVCVSDEFDVRRLTQAILESVTTKTPDFKELNTLHVTLKEKLKGKRFLLILDDVWNENQNEWDLLKAPLDVGASGSKILITTRIREVALISGGTDSVHQLGVLSDKHCYSLFMQCAFPEGNSSEYPHLEVIGMKIVKKCGGLPLAAKTLGRLLYSQEDKEKWNHVLQSKMWDLPAGSKYILPALRLSYHHLSSHLKQCFAYCSLFPKDYEFDKEKLVQLWMAQGYVQPKGTKGLEDIGSEYFDDLFSRCFFQHAIHRRRPTSIVMHDLVHDLAQFVYGELNCRMGDNLSSNISERTRHSSFLFIRYKSKEIANLEALYKAKSLRTVLSLQKYKKASWQPPHDFFQKQRYLRVLDLSSTTTDEIPDSISNLRLLRYLDLNGSEIKMLPESIGRLFNLQTLKLNSCKKLKELPKSIDNLKQLRHLDLSSTPISMLPESLGSLSNLRKLQLCWCNSLDKLPDSVGNLKHLQYIDMSHTSIQMLPESMDNLSNLQELILDCCMRLRELPKNISNLIGLRNLNNMLCSKLDSIPLGIGKLTSLQNLPLFVLSEKSGAKLGELKELNKLKGDLCISGLQNVINANEAKDAALKDKQYLQRLTLKWGDANRNLGQQCVEELVLENLQPHTNLEELEIKGFRMGSRFPNWMSDPSFSKLKRVTLEGNGECCKVLLPLGKFQFLKNLGISKIRGLKHMDCEFCGDFKGFSSLETLNLEHLPDLEELFGVEDKYEFLCLRELTIRNCQKLRKLPDAFPALKKLEIKSCNGLMVLPRLRVLCELTLDSCDNMRLSSLAYLNSPSKLRILSCRKQTTFPEGFMGALPTQPTDASLSMQTSRWLLPTTLECLYISHCYNLESLSLQAFTSLEILEIWNCPKLVSFSELWLPTTLKRLKFGRFPIKDLPKGLKNLTSLESLTILYCNELESLPENGLPNSLRTFRIANSKLLSTRCREGGEDWPKIEHISDIRID